MIIALGIIEALFKIGTELVAESASLPSINLPVFADFVLAGETNPYVNLVYETDNGHKKIEAAQDNPSEEVFESVRLESLTPVRCLLESIDSPGKPYRPQVLVRQRRSNNCSIRR